MPKKLNISSNQRVDLDDFTRAASDYTQEGDNFSRQKVLLSGNSAVARGFRIEISDQVASPGEFTIYNGVGVDKAGNILNNEQQVADARTLTLAGAGLPFYVEIEYTESESDVDSRAFWDPTFSGNNPPGKEFTLNVATRLTPDWQVVQPVGTSAFTVTGSVNSIRIPIAILTTNGSNEITGFTAVNAATVLARDAGTLDTEIEVIDSLVFPTTGNATVGGTAVAITGNDRTNNIISLSGALGVAKVAGDIVVETGPAAAFVPHSADSRTMLFSGDEERGTALVADPEDGAARSDIQLASLKDHVDFLSAQLRELKYGNSRPGNTSTPSITFNTSARYYEYAGSIAGARGWSFTVGDAVTSYGDFNSTADDLGTQLQAAHDLLDVTNGGSIFVKSGTYVWDSVLNIDRPLTLVFQTGVVLGAGTYASNPISIDAAVKVVVEGMPAAPAATYPFPVICSDYNGFEFRAHDSFLQVDLSGATTAVTNNVVHLEDCILTCETTAGAFVTVGSADESFKSITLSNCGLRYDDAVPGTTQAIMALQHSGSSLIEDCIFDLAYSTGSASQFLTVLTGVNIDEEERLTVLRSSFIDTNTGTAKNPIDFAVTAGCVLFDECFFEADWAATTASGAEKSFIHSLATEVVVTNSLFKGMDVPDATTAVSWPPGGVDSYGCYIHCGEPIGEACALRVQDCKFYGPGSNNEASVGVYFTGATQSVVERCYFSAFGIGIAADSSEGTRITNNHFRTFVVDPTMTVSCHLLVMGFGSRAAVISDNYFEHYSGFDGVLGDSYNWYGVWLNGDDGYYAGYIVSNNNFEFRNSGGNATALKLPEVYDVFTGAASPEVVSGNTFSSNYNRGTASSITESTIAAIWSDLSGTGNFGYARNLTISDNSIYIDHNSAARGDIYGIYLWWGSEYEPGYQGGTTITGNSISVYHGGYGDAFGIFYQGVKGTISHNTIAVAGGSGTPGTNSYAAYLSGGWLNFDNNVIGVRTNCDDVVYAEVSAIGGDHNGNISITNNNISVMNDAITHGSIIKMNSLAQIAPRNLVVDNNTILLDSTSDVDIISVSLTATTTAGANASVSGNRIFEADGDATSPVRNAINISGSSAAGWDGVVVSNNVIGTSETALRATNNGAIRVIGSNDLRNVVCNGNSISDWCGTGANRASIYIDQVDRVVCNSNSTAYSGSAGENSIRVTNCPSGNVSANETDGGSWDVAGSTVTVTGSNS